MYFIPTLNGSLIQINLQLLGLRKQFFGHNIVTISHFVVRNCLANPCKLQLYSMIVAIGAHPKKTLQAD